MLKISLIRQAYDAWIEDKPKEFSFESDYVTYFCKVDLNKAIEKDITIANFAQICKLEELANFCIFPIATEQSVGSLDLGYRAIIQTNNEKKSTLFSADELTSLPRFKRRIVATLAGASFIGSFRQLEHLYREKFKNIESVTIVNGVGYHSDLKLYLFPDYLVKMGKSVKKNSYDYFSVNSRLSIRLNEKCQWFSASLTPSRHQEWIIAFHRAFNNRGLVALAFWFGSLFAQQIRHYYKFYPFLEITGVPGAGKSTLITFLNKLIGIKEGYEGVNPDNSSHAGIARLINQRLNLPLIFIEGDVIKDLKQKKIDFDQLKSLYNGNPFRATGVADNPHEVIEIPFRGSLVISQNERVSGSDALQERLVYLHFDKKYHDSDNRKYAQQIEGWKINDVSGFLFESISKEEQVMLRLKELYPFYREQFYQCEGLDNDRISENYALLLALLKVLDECFELNVFDSDIKEYFQYLAIERTNELKRDYSEVEMFWCAYERLEQMGISPNHAKTNDQISINISEIYELTSKHRIVMPTRNNRLIQMLRNGKNYHYLNDVTLDNRRCYTFIRRK